MSSIVVPLSGSGHWFWWLLIRLSNVRSKHIVQETYIFNLTGSSGRHGQRSSSADDALAMLNTNQTEEGDDSFALSSTAERLNALRLHVIISSYFQT